ncbi:uncharacterized protein LOC124885816 [Capsicum annuum]|uniref:uncharacterized protein LOC124885816 n=1 Tax=Capsicum annuum TaxID=4072 RepID=UPI001FB09D9E|nr:uncharacterized protein LOC124885816 [Capsicum annuum]
MKCDAADFVSKCLNCQQVKVEHLRRSVTSQEISLPMWKWEMINKDSVMGLPRFGNKYDSIWSMEKVKIIRERPMKAQSHQKSYADVKRTELEFECIGDHSLVLPKEEINVKDSLTYEEEPVDILDCQVRKLGSKEITLVKVLWKNQKVEEATWESENDMRARYPNLFDLVNDKIEVFTSTSQEGSARAFKVRDAHRS